MAAEKTKETVDLNEVNHYLDAQLKDIVIDQSVLQRSARIAQIKQKLSALSEDDLKAVFQLVGQLTSGKKDKKKGKPSTNSNRRLDAKTLYNASGAVGFDKPAAEIRKI